MNEMQDNKYPFHKRMKDIIVVAAAEAASGKPYQWALLGATTVGLAFEWGPGNEWLIGSVGAYTYDAFDPTTGAGLVGTSVITGVAAGTVSAAEQASLGILMSGTVRTFPKAFKKWDETREHDPFADPSSNKGDIVTGVALGTSAVVIQKNAQNPNRSFKEDAIMATKTSVAIGGVNAALVTGIGITLRVLEDNGFDTTANIIEEVAKNPITYLGIFALYKAAQYRKAKKTQKDT